MALVGHVQMMQREGTSANSAAGQKRFVRVAMGVLVWALVIIAAIYFGDVRGYRDAIGSFQFLPLAGVCALLLGCNLFRIVRLRILVPDIPMLPLARAAFVHQFLAGLFPVKLGELALPVMLARTGKVSGGEAVGVLLSARLLDMGALLGVAMLTLVVAGDSIDPHAPAYGLGALVVLLLVAGGSLWALKAIHAWPAGSSRIAHLARSVLLPVGRLTVSSLFGATAVTVVIWVMLLAAFYLGCVSFQLAAPLAEVALSAAVGNLMAALPVNGIGGVGLSQLSWAGMLSAFGRGFEAALIVGVAVQAVALLTSGTGALVMTGWNLMSKNPHGADTC